MLFMYIFYNSNNLPIKCIPSGMPTCPTTASPKSLVYIFPNNFIELNYN